MVEMTPEKKKNMLEKLYHVDWPYSIQTKDKKSGISRSELLKTQLFFLPPTPAAKFKVFLSFVLGWEGEPVPVHVRANSTIEGKQYQKVLNGQKQRFEGVYHKFFGIKIMNSKK